MIRIPFTKAQGAGNDFLILEGTPENLIASPEETRRLCDHRFGVGADGILFLQVPGRTPPADAELRLLNSDGSEAEISGNGTRCAAAYLAMKGIAKNPLTISTMAGLKTLRLTSHHENRWEFEMAMGAPILSPKKIPFAPVKEAGEPVIGFELPLTTGMKRVTVTSMGNPHCSIEVQGFDWDWRACGKEIERHPFFPRRTNVEFYRVVSRRLIEVRYWERGVGETLSSGTGSCAAALAAIMNKKADSPVTVRTVAGDLLVSWDPTGVTLTGPAEITFQGELFVSGN